MFFPYICSVVTATESNLHCMKSITLRYIVALFVLLVSYAPYAQTSIFRGLSVTEGLSDLVVNALYKDSIGYVWIGTGTSLERFDGVHLKRYPVSGNNEKLKRVNAIAETEGNQIWMGNGMGLWRVNHEKRELDAIAAETIKCGVRSLLADGKGGLYIGSEAGLFIYRQGRLEHILIDPNVLSAANIINGLSFGENGILWMATSSGLYSLELENRKIVPYYFIVEDKHICSYTNIVRIGPVIYLGTMGQGIACFDTRTHKFDSYLDVGCNVISSLSCDGKDLLYVGTDGNGVHFISTKQGRIVRSFQHEVGKGGSLRSNSVYSLLVDRDGLIWVGFYQLGLDYTLYQSELFRTYSYPPYFDTKDMPVRTITFRGSEKLIGSRDGLYFIDEQRGRYAGFSAPQLRSSMIICSYAFQGKYYVGTYGGGMYVLDPVTLTISDFEPRVAQPFVKGQIFCIKSDAEGCLWIGTSVGLFRYKDGRMLNHYTSANSKLPEGNVYEIYFDSTRKGWVCTENGMCIWDPSSESLKVDIFPEGFIHKEKIRTVFEDSAHQLYFLPDKGPMYISDLSMNHFRHLQPNTLLEGKDCMSMIEDDEGWLWIGTSNGLYRYDKQDTFILYHFIDGIPSPIFIFCLPVKDGQGRIWMGNSKGLIYMNTHAEGEFLQHNRPLRITDVFVNGKHPVAPAWNKDKMRVDLENSQNNLTVRFSALNFTDPSYMSYECKLEGKEEGWQMLMGRSDITYYDLSSGNYCFKVRRVGVADSEISMAVHIAYPVMAWIVGAVILIVLSLLCVFYFYRRRGKSKKTVEPLPVAEVEPKTAVTEEKYKTSKISLEECERLTGKLENIMHREKAYTNPDLKVADLAAMIGTSAHTLSYLFNQHLNRNYYDYINDYRIAEFKHLIAKDEYSKYTLGALAELCGFSSRASFFRYFKKATGITPNEYIRSIGKTNE